MKCIRCGLWMNVVDTRPIPQDAEKVRRRRYECSSCKFRMSTVEVEEVTFDHYRKRTVDAETQLYALKKKLREALA